MGTKVFFFAGGLYARYDKSLDRVDAGSLPIAGNWPGMAQIGFANRLDATLHWSGGKVFFFRGDQYGRYDVASDEMDAGPFPIARNWRGLANVGFASGLDAAVNWGNGKVYFFRGTRYVRYDVAANKVDEGYPLPIAGNWPGMADAGFADLIDAALPWGNGKVYFFRGDQYLRYDAADDEVDEGFPLPIAEMWPGMQDIGFSSGITAAIDLLGETSRFS